LRNNQSAEVQHPTQDHPILCKPDGIYDGSSQQPSQTATRDTPNMPPTPSRGDRIAQSTVSRTPRPGSRPTQTASLRDGVREKLTASDTWAPESTNVSFTDMKTEINIFTTLIFRFAGLM
jgi:hypothetical protein